MFGRRMKVGRYVARRRRGRRAIPFLPAATGVEEFFEDEPRGGYQQVGPSEFRATEWRPGEQVELFGEEEIAPGGALMPTVLERPVLNRRQFIRRYQSELKMAYEAACARLRALGRDCPNYSTLAKVAHDIYREHREAGSSRPVLWIIYDASQAVWQGDAPMMLRRMEKTFQQFSKDYKDLINLARQDGNNPAFSTAASAGFAAYKAEPDRRKALEAARIAIMELPRSARRRKKPVATTKKKPASRKPAAKKPLTKTQRAAMRKPPGASCPSAVGRKAAEQQFTIGPTKLKSEIATDSKDVLLYRLQAEMSRAGKRRPRVVAMLKRALAAKGLEKLPAKFDKKPKSKAKPKKRSGTKKGQPRKTAKAAFSGKTVEQRKTAWIKKNKGKVSAATKKLKTELGRGINWVSAQNYAFAKTGAAPSAAEVLKVIRAGVKAKKVLYAGQKRKGTATGAKRKTARSAYSKKPASKKASAKKPAKKKKKKAAAKKKPAKKAAAKPRSSAKTKPHKAAESKAKRAKGKIKTDEKNLRKARAAVAKAPTAKKPAKRKARDKVAAKLRRDKKELAAAKKSVTLHAAKARSKPKTTRKRSAPTTRRSTTTRKAGKSTFRVKGNITVSA